MIPDIGTIIDGLIDGSVTKEQATRWLKMHMDAADATGRLDMLDA